MSKDRLSLVPSNVVMEDYMEAILKYYRNVINLIYPYIFRESLIKMIGFQQLIISSTYKIKREDARSKKGIDQVREFVSKINESNDIIDLMKGWKAFDLCYTAPSFINPNLATNIRKTYCQIGRRSFDCHRCHRIACKNNLIWNESTVILDLDAKNHTIEELYIKTRELLQLYDLEHSIKLSSLNGLHINIGLPKDEGSTIFDRSIFHYTLYQELTNKGIPIDDNSLDPVPIIRAPFSLHYKRLTPSLPVNDNNFLEAIEILKLIETYEMSERPEQAKNAIISWNVDWNVKNSKSDMYEDLIKKWKPLAEKAIFRESLYDTRIKTNVGDYLRKGVEMNIEDEKMALKLLIKEGKTQELAFKIIELNKKKRPKAKKENCEIGDIFLKTQEDLPNKVLQVPPPTILLIIDNATMDDIKAITETSPISVKAIATNTDEGFSLLFKNSNLLRKYSRKWNCRTMHIGGLYSSYHYCSAADIVVAIKMKSVWDRDIKILKELEIRLNSEERQLIVAHLLGLDFCKDNSLKTDGAIMVFKKFISSILNSNYNIIITTDHSGQEELPYFESFIKKRK